CSAQVCEIRVHPQTGTALANANATIVISRDADDDVARVEAEVTSGIAGVRFEDGQKVEVNGDELIGTQRNYHLNADAAATYPVAVTDPRRGTDETGIAEPAEFQITTPGEDGDASLSGFTIEWEHDEDGLDVEVLITQTLLGEDLALTLGPV